MSFEIFIQELTDQFNCNENDLREFFTENQIDSIEIEIHSTERTIFVEFFPKFYIVCTLGDGGNFVFEIIDLIVNEDIIRITKNNLNIASFNILTGIIKNNVRNLLSYNLFNAGIFQQNDNLGKYVPQHFVSEFDISRF